VAEVVKRQDDEMLKSELLELGRRIAEARRDIGVFLEQSAPRPRLLGRETGKVGQMLTLNAAPIDIAPALRQMLFREGRTCVMTSATLGVGRKDLAYFRSRVGADEAKPLQLGSPFNFNQQMKLFVVRKMPDPRGTVMKKRWRIGSNISSGKPTATPLSSSRIIGRCRSWRRGWKIFARNTI
jgi:ATP-dependent DNA helicase DinG